MSQCTKKEMPCNENERVIFKSNLNVLLITLNDF